ncbi:MULTISPECIES: hypothetical protein [Streptomyces]|jgi:hypothetical protein|uniref:hypothetical protein n=1 Tax=Streptomyces TaxID=1883 RepID=UPI00131E3ECB|nr:MULTISPECIES: hypothetical protein [Streptomyces]MDX3244891.1 hypothetical protein [Streptomyces sp. ME18-1-4]
MTTAPLLWSLHRGTPASAERDSRTAQDDYLLVELLCAALVKIRLERQRAGVQARGTR